MTEQREPTNAVQPPVRPSTPPPCYCGPWRLAEDFRHFPGCPLDPAQAPAVPGGVNFPVVAFGDPPLDPGPCTNQHAPGDLCAGPHGVTTVRRAPWRCRLLGWHAWRYLRAQDPHPGGPGASRGWRREYVFECAGCHLREYRNNPGRTLRVEYVRNPDA